MRLKNFISDATRFKHRATGEVIYALPVLAHYGMHIRTHVPCDRVALRNLAYFKNGKLNLREGEWVFIKDSEATHFKHHTTLAVNLYQVTQSVLDDYYHKL